MSTMYLKRTARLPSAEAILGYNDGTVQDLSGAVVRFVMRNASGTVVVYQTATIVDATAGSVRYDWGTNDTLVAGVYSQEWEVTLTGGKVGHFPSKGYNTVVIEDDLKADS